MLHQQKLELTGQISFRQLLLLWQTLDSLDRLYQLTQPHKERVTASFDQRFKRFVAANSRRKALLNRLSDLLK
ncbi:hypothetical protein BZG77_05510 [Salinivibrio sp. IB643]|nr:hypothetical protein BZG77_05510 [Salinivibrio sp. IB643]